MQVHKVTLTIIDHDEVGADEIRIVLENQRYPNRCIRPHVASIETVEIGEWSDDHPLNSHDTDKAEFQRLFPGIVFDGDE